MNAIRRKVVAQIANLLYRGLPIRKTWNTRRLFEHPHVLPTANLLYRRLPICVTGGDGL